MKFERPEMELVLDLDNEVYLLNVSDGDPDNNPNNEIVWGNP